MQECPKCEGKTRQSYGFVRRSDGSCEFGEATHLCGMCQGTGQVSVSQLDNFAIGRRWRQRRVRRLENFVSVVDRYNRDRAETDKVTIAGISTAELYGIGSSWIFQKMKEDLGEG